MSDAIDIIIRVKACLVRSRSRISLIILLVVCTVFSLLFNWSLAKGHRMMGREINGRDNGISLIRMRMDLVQEQYHLGVDYGNAACTYT